MMRAVEQALDPRVLRRQSLIHPYGAHHGQSREEAIHDRRLVLQCPYAYLDELEEINDLKAARRKLQNPQAFASELETLGLPISRFDNLDVEEQPQTLSGAQGKLKPAVDKTIWRTDADIERLVREQHRLIWANRATVFPDHRTRDPIDMLDPVIGLELLHTRLRFTARLAKCLQVNDTHRALLASSTSPLAECCSQVAFPLQSETTQQRTSTGMQSCIS